VDRQDRTELLALGRAIASMREECRLGPRELARDAGVDMCLIGALEAGTLDPDYELLLRLADALGVRPSAFFVRAEEQQQRAGAGEEEGRAGGTGERDRRRRLRR
jgi:transcriptional regulator with XRE-family HTH domain